MQNYENENYTEMVDHPSHYKGKYECIDVMIECFGIEEVKSFCKLNSFKYLWRSKKKKKEKEDLEKSRWYMNKFKELEKISQEIEQDMLYDNTEKTQNMAYNKITK